LEKLQQSFNVTIIWRSFELRPANAPPIPDWYKERIIAARPQFEAMARERYDLEINSGPFGIDSRPSLIGAKFAEAQGKGRAYHDLAFRSYWQNALDISKADVLLEIAENVGLDQNAFTFALSNRLYIQQVDSDIRQAQIYGIQGVPAMIFEEKYLVSGAQPYEVLSDVIYQVSQENS
jgi:predicted DsbA family dithiol-disulfide isomerase